ncbi:aminopeptidase N [Telmatospirillum siberiense]|uniref:Aminopeptidase N n=1 Tax=Telmatospirillum siberiense TaxID=382514 RepID=A0A2N3PLV4_9PROT|nr:aminopeptidase N [Telmatospirillum siberiense]PKU21376.1 aminopeptidase N [Telmatospirillum siberiense]
MPDVRQTDHNSRVIRLSDYRAPDFLIDSVELVFDLGEEDTRVTAHLAIRRNPEALDRPAGLRLEGEALRLLSVALDGESLGENRYRVSDDALIVDGVGEAFTLDVVTLIRPQDNTELSGLYKSGGNFCTQCEAEGFRRITYFLDRPDVMTRFTTTIRAEAKRYPVLLSNGNPVAGGEDPDGRHWARWVDPHPKPSYLFALVAGDLTAVRDEFITRSGRTVSLAIWVRRGDEDKCGHAMASLKNAMAWDERVFGLEYDLDVFNIVAVSDFNMGAMENKGLNIFNTKYVLAKPETATDADYQGIESVIGHEYFHNWTGDRVTCRDWFQLSLKEGLTVFRDQQFSADQGSPAVKRISDVRTLRARQFPEDFGPLAHPVRPESYIEINNFYTATVYEKGAEVVRMIHTLLGPDKFRKGMDLYFARHDNQAVTIEDFVSAMQDAGGVDLSRFKRWYSQAGTPEVTVSERYHPESRRYEMTFRQQTAPSPGQPVKDPFVLPIAIGLLSPEGREMPIRLDGEEAEGRPGTRVLTMTGMEQTFRFIDVAEPPTPSLFRGFSAPVKVKGVPLDRLKFLAAHDGDPFARWEAGQQAATRHLLDLVHAWRRGEALTADPDLLDASRRTLAGGDADPAFAALALGLPAESALADEMAVVDVEAIHAARQFLRGEIGRALGTELAATYERLTDKGSYRPTPAAIGARALRNASLSYLSATGTAEAKALLVAQAETAGNMTDTLAALGLLGDVEGPERAAVFQDFYERWQHDDLVIDKWFALQAVSSLPETLERCRSLLAHPAFDLRNPNRVRSLIGAFSQGNQLRFHEAGGAGYAFLAEQIIAIDPLNATMAARLTQPLGAWKRQDAARQSLMRLALERILAVAGLSKGTFEMASKSLQ